MRGAQVSGEYSGASLLDSDGWFRTRDGGWIDDGGYVYVEGRLDDVIVRGGENLSPGEIEDVIGEHPSVEDVVVYGVPDDQWGEIVVAAVVPRPEGVLTADEIRAWVGTDCGRPAYRRSSSSERTCRATTWARSCDASCATSSCPPLSDRDREEPQCTQPKTVQQQNAPQSLLADFRVVDFTTGIAGPYCTKMLVDAGADVVKIESDPAGDSFRRRNRDRGQTDGALFQYLAAGKRSIRGTVRDEHVRAFVAGADLVVESGELTIDDIELIRSTTPGVDILSITSFGRTGPWAGLPPPTSHSRPSRVHWRFVGGGAGTAAGRWPPR